jgi:nucleotide-binding universal stress UspA family protein
MKDLTILFPTDFSEYGRQALEALLPTIKEGGNHLILVHAARHTRVDAQSDKALVEDAFADFRKNTPELEQVSYEMRWHFGISSDVVLQEADKVEIDLIVMPTRGAPGIERLWGSKTDSVVKRSITPVLVLHEAAFPTEVERIALAVDYEQPIENHRLFMLKEMTRFFKAEVDVVNVQRRESELTRPEKRHRKMLRQQLRDIPHRFSQAQGEEVSEGLTEHAEKENAGMVAVLPRTFGFMEKLFSERVSQRLVYNSKLPLLILA